MPSAKTVKAKRPAIGRKASAAWDDVLDIRHAVGIQSRSGRDHNEERDDIGDPHAHQRVELYARELPGSLQRRPN